MLINKTQQLESNFQMNSFKLMEGPPPGLPKKIPLNKNPNSNMNFNRNEFTQNLIKSPKAQLTNIPPSKEESKKYDNNKNNVNTNMLEKLTQNISKNKIIPSFLIQKKIGDNNASTPSSHLKMNNLQTNINKNSMLKTNTNPNTFGLNASLKPNNLFNFSKK